MTDRDRCALQLGADAFQRQAALAQPLAEVRVVHVQPHLPVKLGRLPRLRRSVPSGVALQN